MIFLVMEITPVIILFPLADSIVCFVQLFFQCLFIVWDNTCLGFGLEGNCLVLTAVSGEFLVDNLGNGD